MFPDYTSVVVAMYHKKAVSGMLSTRLVRPTPANLKRECIAVCTERFRRSDEAILRTFFGQGSDKEACLKAIEKCDNDKFRPLINFLHERTSTPADMNIELLAWLIDFEPRPFELGRKYDLEVSEKGEPEGKQIKQHDIGPEMIILKGTITPDPAISQAFQIEKEPSKRKWLIIVIAILFLALIGYKWVFNNKHKSNISSYGACMYWTGDHFEPISCKPRIGDTLVIPFDTRLQNFRRITTPDTITVKSIEKLWYLKRNGSLEFYTSDGFHPAELRRQLKPLTSYIFEKYLK